MWKAFNDLDQGEDPEEFPLVTEATVMMISSGMQFFAGLLILCDMDDALFYRGFFWVSLANAVLMVYPLESSATLLARAEGTAYKLLVDLVITPVQAVQVLALLGRVLCVVFGGCALRHGLPPGKGHHHHAPIAIQPHKVFVDRSHGVAWPGAGEDDDIEAEGGPAAVTFDFDFAEKPRSPIRFFDEHEAEVEAVHNIQSDPEAAVEPIHPLTPAGGVSFSASQLQNGVSFSQFAAAFHGR